MSDNKLISKEVIQKIDLAQGKLTRCWEQFVLCENSDAFILLSEIFLDIGNIMNVINSMGIEGKYKIDFNKINEVFIEIEKSIVLKDHQLIADLLYYHIKPQLKKWNKAVNEYNKLNLKNDKDFSKLN